VTAAGAGDDRVKRPRLSSHVRLSFDAKRDRWVLMAPERVFVPDEIALEVLRRCTGEASLAEIVDDLAREFDAGHEEIGRDVAQLVHDLRAKGVLVW
jgi:pyrroloquinoline quinone biosynthesis protein D